MTWLAGLETKISVVTWMVGANIALNAITLGALITLAANVGEISGQIMNTGYP